MTDFTTTRTDLLCDPLDNQALRQLLKPRLLPGDGLLAEHFQATAAQSRALSRVLLARAATTFVCQPDQYQENQILGLATPSPSQRSRGLVAHSTLALTTTGKPCGLLDLAYSGPDPRSPAPARRGSRPAEAQEDHQWQVSLASVGARLPAPTEVILIQDCEADYYDYLATPRPAHLHLLLRATHDRVIERLSPDTAGESQLQSVALFTLAAAAPVLGELSVLVPRRTATRTQLATPARQAHLMVRSQEVTLLRPPGSLAEARQLTLRVLEASERELPAGETPVRWVLLSSLAAADADAACELVRHYWSFSQIREGAPKSDRGRSARKEACSGRHRTPRRGTSRPGSQAVPYELTKTTTTLSGG